LNIPCEIDLLEERRLESLLSRILISTSVISNKDPGGEAFQPPLFQRL
jgi:hypothetical protein